MEGKLDKNTQSQSLSGDDDQTTAQNCFIEFSWAASSAKSVERMEVSVNLATWTRTRRNSKRWTSFVGMAALRLRGEDASLVGQISEEMLNRAVAE